MTQYIESNETKRNEEAEEKTAEEILLERLADQLYNGEIDQRLAAVDEIIDAHNIDFYPVLRHSVMNDPEQSVRDAVRKATYVLEDEFGEAECLAVQEQKAGSPVEGKCCAEESAYVGNYLGASLNDFR